MILPACLLALFLFTAKTTQAKTTLPSVLSSHMVLQRNEPVRVWGWDNPGTRVQVTLGAKTVNTTAGKDGRWKVVLPAHKAGGPFQLKVLGTTEIVLEDILFGEVWLCSGQSNMEFPVGGVVNAKQEIASADHPRIRHIKIPHRPAAEPQDDVPSAGWKVCSPKTVAGFTAVGYFYAVNLLKQLDVPIGLIGSNWGGTRIEPWTPPVGFRSVSALKSITNSLDQYPSRNSKGQINHQTPLALYNGMIHPLLPYRIRGALWYQGESNNGEGMLYYEKMKALVQGWRSVWDEPELPFYYVQLAPFRYGRRNPEHLAGIWEAQLKALTIPHTGMAVTVDIGNVKDIHPKNKQEVGRRLALWALAETYGKPIAVYSGPLYREMKVDGNKIRISFDHVGGGLISRDGKPLNWFTIAGEDKQFVPANAVIEGNTVVVSSEQVAKPAAVRFAWQNSAEPNLANKEGLPASPFRTEAW